MTKEKKSTVFKKVFEVQFKYGDKVETPYGIGTVMYVAEDLVNVYVRLPSSTPNDPPIMSGVQCQFPKGELKKCPNQT